MSDKKYFWLKLPRNFFDKHYVKMLMAKENGVNLTLFYIRLLTESIDHEGKLRYSESTPYNNTSIAEVTGFSPDFVENAMEVLAEMELAITDSDGTIFLPKSEKMIGSESGSAARVRRFRDKQKTEEKPPKPVKKQETPKKKEIRPEIKEIIDFLNEQTGAKYKPTTAATQKAINGRLDEGYTVEDFKTVIKSKTEEWLNDDKWRKYLTPDTLFRPSNFEKYLQTAQNKKPKSTQYAGLSEKLAKETEANLQNLSDDGGFA